MSRFLRFAVEQTLDGKNDELKEYSIALEVFDKDESFDPRIDPTVRSEARRLRTKLAEYYESGDGGDEIVIELPKGSYIPVFRNVRGGSAPAAAPAPVRARRWYLLVAAALLIGAGLAWWLLRRPAPQPPRSIAVLPFENLSADPANEYFSDGLTEEVLNALANIPGFKVAARTSSFQFKGKHESIQSIGKKLNVEVVLEGSVRKEGDRIRITPQLINVADGYHLWSTEYDREWKDLFGVQRDIATAIAAVLGGKLGHAEPRPVDAETYRLYLEGRYHFDKWNAAEMSKAIPLFEQAIARDPNYAPAFSSVAAAYGLLAAFGGTTIPHEVSSAKSKAAALKAIELDPASGEGWVALAPHLVEEFDWPAAESAFHKAIALSPNSVDAHAYFAELYLTPTGRLDEALREAQIAVGLDPISPYAITMVGRRYYFLRQYDSAIAWLRKALDLEPRFNLAVSPLMHSYLSKQDVKGARDFLEASKPYLGERSLALEWSKVYAAEGNRAEALKSLDAAAAGIGNGCAVAEVYLELGDRAQALSWLDRTIEGRSACSQGIPADPRLDKLRQTPEYEALMHKMKLR